MLLVEEERFKLICGGKSEVELGGEFLMTPLVNPVAGGEAEPSTQILDRSKKALKTSMTLKLVAAAHSTTLVLKINALVETTTEHWVRMNNFFQATNFSDQKRRAIINGMRCELWQFFCV